VDHDNALGEFLRAQRERLSAADAGLPEYGPRRVPGLRREEVALLAGVSIDYYTRLEQGRERHPSEQVLDAVVRALQLDVHAAGYLFRLAQPAPRAARAESPRAVSTPLMDLLVDALDVPATVTGPALDVLAANDLARVLYEGFARFDNLVRMVFLDPAAPMFYADWDHAARGVVSNLRATSAPFPHDPQVLAVVGELTLRSPAFVAQWARREVRPRTNEDKHLHHPRVGDLHLRYQAFAVADAPGQQVFVYTAPPGSPSADGLALLRRLTAAEHDTTPDDDKSSHDRTGERRP
jgi:transcriptional regulator with XRE-family HTH domain